MRLRDTPHDFLVLRECYFQNDYGVPDEFGPDDVVIDLGAHVGVFATRCVHSGCKHIVCVEPDRDNFLLLVENVEPFAATRGVNVRLVHAAAWDRDRGYLVHHPDHATMHRVYDGEDIPFEADSSVNVPCLLLDDLIGHFASVALLKVDIEGAELRVLMSSKLLGRVRRVAMETHGGGEAADACIAVLAVAGHKVVKYALGPGDCRIVITERP